MLKHTLKQIGFTEGKYTAHDFRATCATEWMEAGVPLKTISAMLGHRDTRTTERYYERLRPEVAYEGVAETPTHLFNSMNTTKTDLHCTSRFHGTDVRI